MHVEEMNKALLKKAQDYKNTEHRDWKKSSTVFAYVDSAPSCLYVLLGTPPRGFIIAVRGSIDGLAEFHRYDGRGKKLKTFTHDI